MVKKEKKERIDEMMWRHSVNFKKELSHHKTKSYELQVLSNPTLFVFILSSAQHSPSLPTPMRIKLVGADC